MDTAYKKPFLKTILYISNIITFGVFFCIFFFGDQIPFTLQGLLDNLNSHQLYLALVFAGIATYLISCIGEFRSK